jgi:hypothetical protein
MKILTGNDLRTGAVIWWDGANWSLYVDCAADVGFHGAEIIAREEALRRVTGAYEIEATASEAGVRPAHIKDRIRALGPTVRPDLTLKPQSPEAIDWVI